MKNKTKNSGIVPKLRFPAFRAFGNWDLKSLGDISAPVLDKVGELALPTVSITAGYGFVTQESKFGRDISGNQYKNYILLTKGEFSYNKGNSKKYPQGCIYELKEFEQVAAPNAFISFRLNSGYVSDFYQNLFEANHHGVQLKKFITSGARSNGLLNIKPEDFFSIQLPAPKESEQQKIADCLTSLDSRISAESEKLDALKDHKKGLMQNLFPVEGETMPKLRFKTFRDKSKWNRIELGEIFSERQETGFPDLPLLSLTANEGIIFQSDSKRMNTSNVDKSKYLRVVPRDIAYNTMRMWEGRSAFVDREGLVSPAYTVCKPEGLTNSLFFSYYFKTPQLIRLFHKYSQGLVKDTLNLKYENFMRILVYVPPTPEEQQAIANCLASVDSIIVAESQKLEKLESQKKGLMQQLFPSVNAVI